MFKRLAGKIVVLGALASGLALVLAITPSEAQERQAPAGNAVQQGIQVHGHWVIEVRNHDGSTAARREFENALVPPGAYHLVDWLLPGGFSSSEFPLASRPVGWMVDLIYSSGLYLYLTTPAQCIGLPSYWFQDLVVTATGSLTSPAVPKALVLTGSHAAIVGGTIGSVRTAVIPGGSNGVCGVPWGFTSATLPEPVAVLAGQSVSVTVTITFQ